MNEHDILTHLKILKHLKPDEKYCRTSLALILKTPRTSETRERPMIRIIRGGALMLLERASLMGVAVLFIVMTVAAFNFMMLRSPLALTGVDLSHIIAEADSIDIHIDLPELGYTENVQERTNTQLSKTKTGSSPQPQKEFTPLKESSDEEINELLRALSK
jgi:hypothetical protein